MKPRRLAAAIEAAWTQIDRVAYRIEALHLLLCLRLQALPEPMRSKTLNELNALRLAHEAYSTEAGETLLWLEGQLRAAGRLPRES